MKIIGKEVKTVMSWKQMTPEQKVKWLNTQLEDIKRATALIERFEKITRKWLKKAKAQESKKQS